MRLQCGGSRVPMGSHQSSGARSLPTQISEANIDLFRPITKAPFLRMTKLTNSLTKGHRKVAPQIQLLVAGRTHYRKIFALGRQHPKVSNIALLAWAEIRANKRRLA